MNLSLPVMLYVVAALLVTVGLVSAEIRAIGLSVICIVMALMIKENEDKNTSA